MNGVLVVAALIGATLIITNSTLFEHTRRLWPTPLNCPQCVGTWIGLVAGGFGIVELGHGRILDSILVGAATSFLASLGNAILIRLLEKD